MTTVFVSYHARLCRTVNLCLHAQKPLASTAIACLRFSHVRRIPRTLTYTVYITHSSHSVTNLLEPWRLNLEAAEGMIAPVRDPRMSPVQTNITIRLRRQWKSHIQSIGLII